MPSKPSDPFSLDAAIKDRLLKLPETVGGGYTIASVLGDSKAQDPEFWRLTSESASNLQSTAIDRNPSQTSSQLGFLENSDLTITGRHKIETSLGTVTFRGNALLCTCPDCRAPMTIRLWLGLADCWQCPASVALDERVMAQLANEVARRSNDQLLPPPPPRDFLGREPLATVAPPVQPAAPLLLTSARQASLLI